MAKKVRIFWDPRGTSPEDMTEGDALALKEATGDNAIALAMHGSAHTPSGDIYVAPPEPEEGSWFSSLFS